MIIDILYFWTIIVLVTCEVCERGGKMFALDVYDAKKECGSLALTDDIFHQALELGAERYHVDCKERFDIVYVDNDSFEPKELYPPYVKPPYMPKYRHYNEYDRKSLYIDVFNGFSDISFESVNEYNVAVARVCLKFTEMELYFTDERIGLFVPESNRLHVVDALPENRGTPGHMLVKDGFDFGFGPSAFCAFGITYAFHNVFFMQWVLDGKPLENYKYVTLRFDDHGGLGSNLARFKKYEQIFGLFGLKFILLDDHFGKYPLDMLSRYFSFDFMSEEANEDNTLIMDNFAAITRTKYGFSLKPRLDESILQPSFKAELDFYYDSIFNDKKVLGVLIRGTDYFTAGLKGMRMPATVSDMKEMITEWVGSYGYEKIFLATEDREILDQMRELFPEKLVVISQDRLKIEDLKPGQIISELEKELYEGVEYRDRLEDTTANYFYALYILSRCDGFICSGHCNGYDIVMDLNADRFSRSYLFQLGMK